MRQPRQRAAIDTNFFIESAGELPEVGSSRAPYSEPCREMLNLAGHKYECVIPLIVPGELLAFLIEKVGSLDSRRQLLSLFKQWLIDGRFRVVKMDHPIENVLARLEGLRLNDYQDRMIVACSLAAECDILFTTDGKIKGEEAAISKLSRDLNRKALHVAHPGDSDFRQWVG